MDTNWPAKFTNPAPGQTRNLETTVQNTQAMRASSKRLCIEYRVFCAASDRDFVKYRV